VTTRQRPARPCTWHDCPAPAVATVAFALPNLLAGNRRDDCADHTSQLCLAPGTVLVARFGAQQPALPGLGGSAAAGRPTPRGRRRRKEVIS
jgi:hypothetical protein